MFGSSLWPRRCGQVDQSIHVFCGGRDSKYIYSAMNMGLLRTCPFLHSAAVLSRVEIGVTTWSTVEMFRLPKDHDSTASTSLNSLAETT